VRARKRFGQHFLEPAWVDKVVAAIDPQPADALVEIGPGRGALTRPLAARAGRLLVVEIDRELAEALRTEALPRTTVVTADVLELDWTATLGDWLGEPVSPAAQLRAVGNLPYNVSSPILFALLDLSAATGALRDATLMLQAEVADRLVAPVGTAEYGVLTLLTSLGASTERVLSLPPGAFRPPPKVRSALVRLAFRPPPVPHEHLPLVVGMVRSMFTQRRKTIANALRAFADRHGRPPVDALRLAGIDPRRRPETLQLVEIVTLAEIFAAAAE
jgi:16S rRNA (adenine1518-N6/adenine1519-N6)-dimethyltransferase